MNRRAFLKILATATVASCVNIQELTEPILFTETGVIRETIGYGFTVGGPHLIARYDAYCKRAHYFTYIQLDDISELGFLRKTAVNILLNRLTEEGIKVSELLPLKRLQGVQSTDITVRG